MNVSFSLKEMFLLGWPILSVLILCSVLSLAVILERFVFFRKRKINVNEYSREIPAVILAGKEALMKCAVLGEPMCTITRSALMASHNSHSRESLELLVDRGVRLQVAEMERFVPTLGTIASAAPFIGLLGTVIGIIRAFRSLAIAGAGGPSVVAGGIAEALVATAFGLFVAIPALVAYNYYSTRIRRMTEQMEICGDNLLEILTKKQ